MTWAKGVVTWHEQDALCISVPFTWLLKEARGIAYNHPNERVVVGGPAVRLMPDYLADVAEVETLVPDEPLRRANPDASRTTFGCPNSCAFCGVKRIEGDYRELRDWRPAPILCDSNFLACSDAHFDRVIDALKRCDFPEVDFNQGLDANLLTKRRAEKLAELNIRPRFAWDTNADEGPVMRAVERLEQAGVKCRSSSPENNSTARVRVYCLVGWRETPEEATVRLETLRNARLGAVAMRYQPLDALKRNAFCPPQWDRRELAGFCRFWNKQRWFGGMTFEQYRAGQHEEAQEVLW